MELEVKNVETDKAVSKEYTDVLKKLKLVLQDKPLELPSKVPANDLTEIVEELFSEERKNNKAKFKTDLSSLLKKHVELKKEIEKKKKELETLEKDKQKEFVKACKEVFSQISDLNSLSELTDSLNQALQ